MSKPAKLEQEGPLGEISEWDVSLYEGRILVILRGTPGDPEDTASGHVAPADAAHLRDFARALDRAAAALEAAEGAG